MKMYGQIIVVALLSSAIVPSKPVLASDSGAGDTSRSAPTTIVVSTVGGFAEGYSWYLSVNPSGNAELFVDAWPQPIRKSFTVTREQLTHLSAALDQEQFFALKDEYGQHIADGSTDTLTIVKGDEVKSVKTHFLMNWVHSDPDKLHEPARAVRVFNIIRNWFDEPLAVDLRRYDQMVLDAVEKSKEAQPEP